MEGRLFSGRSRRAIGMALAVATVPNPVHAVLCLITAFVSVCGLRLRQGREYMALVLVVVYVGAIAVLFLFVVMMLNLVPERDPALFGKLRTIRTGLGVAERLRRSFESSWVDFPSNPSYDLGSQPLYIDWTSRLDPRSTLEVLGQVLYTDYFVYVVMAGFILLVARVVAIVLTLKVRSYTLNKRQQLHQQLSRDPSHAVRMARVPASRGRH